MVTQAARVAFIAAHTASLVHAGQHVGYDVWSAPAAFTVAEDQTAPVGNGGFELSTAKNEHEAIQLVVRDTRGLTPDCNVEAASEAGGGYGFEVAFYQGDWDGSGAARHLTPVNESNAFNIRGRKNAILWIDVYTPAWFDGEGLSTVDVQFSCTGGAAPTETFSVELLVYVFAFQLPGSLNFVQDVVAPDLGAASANASVKAIDTFFHHRASPIKAAFGSTLGGETATLTPHSLGPAALWDCAGAELAQSASDTTTGSLLDKVGRYAFGNGWNCVGFPQLLGFSMGGDFRAQSFCGHDPGTAPIDWKFSVGQWLLAFNEYVVGANLTDKVYYIAVGADAGRPAVLEMCDLGSTFAPDVRRAIAAAPDPAIADICTFHIWTPTVDEWSARSKGHAWNRLAVTEEEVWLRLRSSIDSDVDLTRDPYPKVVTNSSGDQADGMGARMLGFIAWTQRMRGIVVENPGVYPSIGTLSPAAERLRDAAEDYEYLWLLNNMKHPKPCNATRADEIALFATTGLTSWTSDVSWFMALRHALGLHLEGQPFRPPAFPETNASRYINFITDDSPLPTTGNPALTNISWSNYSVTEYSGNGSGAAGWLSAAAVVPLLVDVNVSLYNDTVYGTAMGSNTSDLIQFRFDTPPGVYNVSVAAGTGTGTPTVMVNGHVAIAGDAMAAQMEGFVSVMSHGSIIVTVHGERNENNHLVVYPSLCYVVAVPAEQGPANVMKGECAMMGLAYQESMNTSYTGPHGVRAASCAPPPNLPPTSSMPQNSTTATDFTTVTNSSNVMNVSNASEASERVSQSRASTMTLPSPTDPIGGSAAESSEKGWAARYWWVWVIGGVLVLAGIAGLFLSQRSRVSQQPDGLVPFGEFVSNPAFDIIAHAPACRPSHHDPLDMAIGSHELHDPLAADPLEQGRMSF